MNQAENGYDAAEPVNLEIDGPEFGRFNKLLGDCEILETAGTDYAFRLFVSKPAWTQVLAGLAEETDYDNFKSEVARHQGGDDAVGELPPVDLTLEGDGDVRCPVV